MPTSNPDKVSLELKIKFPLGNPLLEVMPIYKVFDETQTSNPERNPWINEMLSDIEIQSYEVIDDTIIVKGLGEFSRTTFQMRNRFVNSLKYLQEIKITETIQTPSGIEINTLDNQAIEIPSIALKVENNRSFWTDSVEDLSRIINNFLESQGQRGINIRNTDYNNIVEACGYLNNPLSEEQIISLRNEVFKHFPNASLEIGRLTIGGRVSKGTFRGDLISDPVYEFPSQIFRNQ